MAEWSTAGWQTAGGRVRHGIFSEKGRIAIVDSNETDARLIASAPALLESCRNLLRAIEGEFPTDEARDRLTAIYCASAEAAITEATGVEP